MTVSADALPDHLPDAATVLLLGDESCEDACASLLGEPSPAEATVLWVTAGTTPDERLLAWQSRTGADLPVVSRVVDVGGRVRSAAADGAETVVSGSGMRIATVPDPTDLTGLGIRVSEDATALAEAGGRPLVCVHSLSALLEANDEQRCFRFVHALVGFLAATGALAHFHLDPDAVDATTASVFTNLFDAVVECDPSGGVTVRTRP